MKKSKKFLVGMFVLHFAAGLLEPITPIHSQPQLLAAFMWPPLAMLLFAWCKADIAERSIESPPGAAVLVGLLAPVGVPYYFFRALPWRSAMVASSLGGAAFVGMQVILVLGTVTGGALYPTES